MLSRAAAVALTLVLSGCASSPLSSDATEAAPPPSPPTEALTTTTAPESNTTVGGNTATTSGRPIAPDFTLTLGTGGTFVLSEETRPVYLVFWAEW